MTVHTAPDLATASLQDLRWTGTGLKRPECVLANSRGDVYTADWRSGVAHIHTMAARPSITLPQWTAKCLSPTALHC